MKAIRIHKYGGSDQIRTEELPKPSAQAGEILVRIRDAGVNPVDWKIREGHLKEWIHHSFPFTLGQDFAGEVAEVGAGVEDFRDGDRIFGFAPGSYAEFAVVKPSSIARIPEILDFTQAASLPTAGLTAYQLIVNVVKASKGHIILIHGAAGGVGSLAVQIAKHKEAQIIATASSTDADYLKGLGVEQVIDYKSQRFEELVQEVDAVIDLVGGETLKRSYGVIKKGGLVVTTADSIDHDAAAKRELRAVEFVMKQDARQLGELAALVEQGIVKPRVNQVLPLTDARKAHELSQGGRAHGKILLEIVPEPSRAPSAGYDIQG